MADLFEFWIPHKYFMSLKGILQKQFHEMDLILKLLKDSHILMFERKSLDQILVSQKDYRTYKHRF